MNFNRKSVKLLVCYYFFIAVVAFWYMHADEHFQIVEFASYKAGITPLDAMPWEFEAKIRSSIMPFIAFLLIKLFSFFGIENPFVIGASARVIATLFFIYSLYRIAPFFLDKLELEADKKKIILFTLCFWIMPSFMTRFSSESFSASFFWIGFALFDSRKSYESDKLKLILIGILFGFSFYFRFQIAFLLLFLFIWSIIYLRKRFFDWFFIAAGTLIPLIAEYFTNLWLYGEFVFSPYRYFRENIINNVAATFGTEPFYYYFQCFFLFFTPPVGLFIILGMFFYAIKFKHSVFTYLLIGFVGFHSLIGHKEFRFMVPVFSIMVPMAYIGFLYWFKHRKIVDVCLKVFIILNLILLPTALIVKSTRSLNYFVIYFDSLHENQIYCDKLNPYCLNNRFPNAKHYFMKRRDLQVIETHKDSLTAGQNYFITRHYYGETFFVNKNKYIKTYQTLPKSIVKRLPVNVEDPVGVTYIYKSETLMQ
ncbi:MAG: hypothetical protein IPM95_02665 [Sphingobacteriales bacterium]|nr:hypothetical protein [Sphingobacteriales bacterium]